MRLREFAKIKEAPMGPGGGAIGGAIGDFAKRVAYLPNMYIELYKQYRQERLAKEKAKTAREKAAAAKKEKETKTKLEKVASKMNPEQQAVAKKAVEKVSSTTTPTIRLVKGQRAQGGDGQEYVFGGGEQWINTATGDDAKRDVAHTLFKQFLP